MENVLRPYISEKKKKKFNLIKSYTMLHNKELYFHGFSKKIIFHVMQLESNNTHEFFQKISQHKWFSFSVDWTALGRLELLDMSENDFIWNCFSFHRSINFSQIFIFDQKSTQWLFANSRYVFNQI